jgi:hypothetical protein
MLYILPPPVLSLLIYALLSSSCNLLCDFFAGFNIGPYVDYILVLDADSRFGNLIGLLASSGY